MPENTGKQKLQNGCLLLLQNTHKLNILKDPWWFDVVMDATTELMWKKSLNFNICTARIVLDWFRGGQIS